MQLLFLQSQWNNPSHAKTHPILTHWMPWSAVKRRTTKSSPMEIWLFWLPHNRNHCGLKKGELSFLETNCFSTLLNKRKLIFRCLIKIISLCLKYLTKLLKDLLQMIQIVMVLISRDFKIEMLVPPKEEEKAIKERSQTGMRIQKIGRRRTNRRYKMAKKKMNQIPTGLNLILKLTKRSFGAMSCTTNKNSETESSTKRSKNNSV